MYICMKHRKLNFFLNFKYFLKIRNFILLSLLKYFYLYIFALSKIHYIYILFIFFEFNEFEDVNFNPRIIAKIYVIEQITIS